MRPSVGDKCYSISIDSFTIREMTKFRADCVIFTTTADTFIPTSDKPERLGKSQGGMNKPVISRRMTNLALLMTRDESPDFPWPRSEWKLPPARVGGGQWRPIRGHDLGLGQNTLVTLLWWQIEALVHCTEVHWGFIVVRKENNDLNMMETWQKLEQAMLTINLSQSKLNTL